VFLQNASLSLSLSFDSAGRIAGMYFKPSTEPTPSAGAYQPPPYVDLTAFTERGVTVGSGQWALPGTLSVPNSRGPFPAVVLVPGSGPNDRDETLGANKPFRDLAWGLASRGIVVLRYEKRTREHADLFTPDVLQTLTLQARPSLMPCPLLSSCAPNLKLTRRRCTYSVIPSVRLPLRASVSRIPVWRASSCSPRQPNRWRMSMLPSSPTSSVWMA